LELVRQLNNLLGTNVEPIHAPPRAGDIRESLADITSARSALGYEPRVGFDEGLQRSIAYYRELVASRVS
jgi:UDP-glucose 4-epimerase